MRHAVFAPLDGTVAPLNSIHLSGDYAYLMYHEGICVRNWREDMRALIKHISDTSYISASFRRVRLPLVFSYTPPSSLGLCRRTHLSYIFISVTSIDVWSAHHTSQRVAGIKV